MNYGKKGTDRRSKEFSRSSYGKKRIAVLIAKIVMILFLLATAAVVCIGIFFVKGVINEAPEIDIMDATPSGYMSTVLDSEGEVTAELVSSGANRIYAKLDEIPADLQHAFVAIEDARFYEHHGIDVKGILRAGVKGLTSGNFSEGASTLTQQLLKNNVFDDWTSESGMQRVVRKIQEQYLALELEKQVSKDWIMENYLNTINLGQNTLGVQAASQRYFGKDVSDLNLSECAVLAAITQNPSRYNPITNPEENQKRREKVLKSMLDQGYIGQEEYDEALRDDVYSRIETNNQKELESGGNITTYFVDALTEQIIDDLQTELGYTESQAYKELYSGGLTIYSTQDSKIQKICDKEANDDSNYAGKAEVSFSYALTIELDNGETKNYSEQTLRTYFQKKTGNKDYSINYSSEEKAKAAISEYREAVLKENGGTVLGENITFNRQPQAALTVMDQSTGYVKALVGGRGAKTGSQTLNRATDTIRQPGSTFKIISTYAPALDTGKYTLATSILDEPYTYENGKQVQNVDHRYRGYVTVREAIADSINVIAVKTLTDITPQTGYEYVKNFGITTLTEDDVNQPMALGGVGGVKNIEMTGAFGTIANQGVYTEPILYTKILDHDGNVLLEREPETHTVLKESTAYLLTSAMEDVIKSGTGVAANFSGMSIAGKTGTTNESRSSWFAGYSPYYTCVIWGGNDDNSPLSSTRFTRVIWKNIMQQIHQGKTDPGFQAPEDIVKEKVCDVSGQLPVKGICKNTHTEYFAKGTEPDQQCQLHVEATICTESGLLAGDYCPDRCKKTEVFIKEPEEGLSEELKEKENVLPDKVCDVHTKPSDKGILSGLLSGLRGHEDGEAQKEEEEIEED